jgi:diguanylate cyclase (GGDEF)-like protein
MNIHVQFKQINDSYGHLVGDAVLREVSSRMVGSVRTYDFIGRYGGEEFLIIIPSCDPGDLKIGAERLRRCIADQPIETSAGPIASTISIGVASAPMAEGGTSELEALLKVSDDALYRAKHGGRNRVEIVLATRAAIAGR